MARTTDRQTQVSKFSSLKGSHHPQWKEALAEKAVFILILILSFMRVVYWLFLTQKVVELVEMMMEEKTEIRSKQTFTLQAVKHFTKHDLFVKQRVSVQAEGPSW